MLDLSTRMSEQMDLPVLSEENIEKLSNLLDEWKLKFLLPQFIAEKIDLEILEIIDASHINLLLHNYPIGVQIRFVHNLIAWRKNVGIPLNEKAFDRILTTRSHKESYSYCNASEASTVLCDTNKSIIESNNTCCKNVQTKKDSLANTTPRQKLGKSKPQLPPQKIDLKQILLNSPPNGPDLIDLYGKQQQHFTLHDRKRLMSTIVNYFLECKMPLNLQISYELENAIVQMFPSESLQKYRNSRYGKLYLLYLREKTEQVDSETYSDIEETQENNSPHVSDDDNVSDSLMCDLYDKEHLNEVSDDEEEPSAEELDHHDILIQTIYKEHKKFAKIRPPYQYNEFLTTARTIFRISNIDDYCLYYNELKIDELNFKSIISQHYKSITFTVQLKLRSECKEILPSSNILPDAKFIRNITNLLPYTKLSDKGKPLENSHRTIIAKTIIEECLRSNSERILKRQDFLTLADNICKAFHTEVPSTYFIPCSNSQPARGKLLNAYNNKRYALSALGRLERRPRGTSRKRKRYTYMEEDKSHDDNSRKLRLAESKDFSVDTNQDIDKLLQRWQESHKHRQKELEDGLKPSEYLSKYSVLKTIRGIDLVESDVKILYSKMSGIENWMALYDMVVEKVRNVRNFKKLQATIEAIDGSKDNRYRASLTLNLLVYIFPYTWRFSKSEVQERFLKEYKTMEDLKSDGDPADLQIRFIHQSQQIIYADFCVSGCIFKCVDLLEALTYLFHYILALNLSYPRMCLRIWQFVQLAIFKVDKVGDVLLPQIECTINDLLYREKK